MTKPVDSVQGFMNSFRQFEKKLDKLQDDVKIHGSTLSDLRVMVANLSVAINADNYIDDIKHPIKRNTAIQYDERYLDHPIRMRRKNAIIPLPSKLKAKSLQDQKYGLRMSEEAPYHLPKTSSVGKQKRRGAHVLDAPRKGTVFRKQKSGEKKVSKMHK